MKILLILLLNQFSFAEVSQNTTKELVNSFEEIAEQWLQENGDKVKAQFNIEGTFNAVAEDTLETENLSISVDGQEIIFVPEPLKILIPRSKDRLIIDQSLNPQINPEYLRQFAPEQFDSQFRPYNISPILVIDPGIGGG